MTGRDPHSYCPSCGAVVLWTSRLDGTPACMDLVPNDDGWMDPGSTTGGPHACALVAAALTAQ